VHGHDRAALPALNNDVRAALADHDAAKPATGQQAQKSAARHPAYFTRQRGSESPNLVCRYRCCGQAASMVTGSRRRRLHPNAGAPVFHKAGSGICDRVAERERDRHHGPEVENARSDRTLVVAAVIGGLLLWFTYVAVQPHDLFGPHAGTPASLRTLFGWRAPSYPLQRDPHLIINPPDRSWIVLAGWPLLALLLGLFAPQRPWLVGIAVVAPTAVVYLPTVPLDIDGLGRGGILLLPFVAFGACLLCFLTATIRSRRRCTASPSEN
jgi:hypothetical protein